MFGTVPSVVNPPRRLFFAACAALVACNPSTPALSPPAATQAPSAPALRKTPLRGLLDMQDISWHNVNNGQPHFTIANARKFPGILGGIIINATWSQMQPRQGGVVQFSAVDSALSKIDAYNAANPATPLGVKLRIYGGSNAPRWAKLLGNGPITIYRNPAGCDGKTDTCKLTVGPFWTKPYIDAWRAFQAQVAARYDTDPMVIAVAVTSCAAQTDEPFVASTGPVSKANLAAAGYSDAAEQACLKGATDDYRAWAKTDVDFPFNAYSDFRGGQDASFTIRVMRICRRRSRHALRPRQSCAADAVDERSSHLRCDRADRRPHQLSNAIA